MEQPFVLHRKNMENVEKITLKRCIYMDYVVLF